MRDTGRCLLSRDVSSQPHAPKGLWTGIKFTSDRIWHATTSLAEDFVILGQFAFGREYISR